ncbi:MAG: hypothetical protein MUO78_09785, partial [candidate division Zixibacteria bacterium]|nr:hypothetical protein [candidate division Zixibacteria bacterium]
MKLFYESSFPTTLENIPLDSWVYSSIEELYTQGFFPELHRNVRPYTRGNIASYLKEINSRKEKGDLNLTQTQSWIIEKLNQEFKYELRSLSVNEKEEPKKLKALLNPILYLVNNESKSESNGDDSSYIRGKSIMEGAFQWRNFLFKDRVIIDTEAEKEKNLFGQKWKSDLTGIFDQGY